MLSTYFKHPFTLRKLRAGPAGPYLDDFASQLAQAGYCRVRIRAYLRGTGRFSAWASSAGLAADALDWRALAQFRRFLESQGRLRYRRGECSDTFLGARHFVGFLQDRGVVPTPAPAVEPVLLTEFCHWMRTQRGVTETTLRGYRLALRRLLVALGHHPEHYTAKQLRRFILDHTQGHRPPQAKTTVTVLRMCLRFLIAQGRCAPELLIAIPTIAGWRRASLPSYLSAEEIERVIDTCDGTTAIGARNRAVVLLLARLGLRAGDVAALRLTDIDWEQGLFRVSGKNRRQTALPLPQEVGEALLHYVTKYRPPVNTTHVFITATAPFVPFSMVAGAGAFFAATVRAPVTGIVLAAELTGNFQLILPVAIACISATLVAHALGGRPIYTVMLERTLEAK